ncbi:hypothetical protein WICPIJ_004853 [Wickerhamomyces pijperi]|uniref:Uncharacterized protein n=1 Tax=Wickerhamomyces pijperi TaxID=599730 RepID=A0A9P8Q6W0_WICPI|nr:hypothetical protein WICPIJ_004853 [Wickerhamomyces pijperi]
MWLIGLACDICGSTDGAGGSGGSDCDASANAVMAGVWFVDGCLMLNEQRVQDSLDGVLDVSVQVEVVVSVDEVLVSVFQELVDDVIQLHGQFESFELEVLPFVHVEVVVGFVDQRQVLLREKHFVRVFLDQTQVPRDRGIYPVDFQDPVPHSSDQVAEISVVRQLAAVGRISVDPSDKAGADNVAKENVGLSQLGAIAVFGRRALVMNSGEMGVLSSSPWSESGREMYVSLKMIKNVARWMMSNLSSMISVILESCWLPPLTISLKMRSSKNFKSTKGKNGYSTSLNLSKYNFRTLLLGNRLSIWVFNRSKSFEFPTFGKMCFSDLAWMKFSTTVFISGVLLSPSRSRNSVKEASNLLFLFFGFLFRSPNFDLNKVLQRLEYPCMSSRYGSLLACDDEDRGFSSSMQDLLNVSVL